MAVKKIGFDRHFQRQIRLADFQHTQRIAVRDLKNLHRLPQCDVLHLPSGFVKQQHIAMPDTDNVIVKRSGINGPGVCLKNIVLLGDTWCNRAMRATPPASGAGYFVSDVFSEPRP